MNSSCCCCDDIFEQVAMHYDATLGVKALSQTNAKDSNVKDQRPDFEIYKLRIMLPTPLFKV
jgi:hypothetical protein